MRLDHSIKNVFILPGVLIPLATSQVRLSYRLSASVIIGVLSCTLIACSNYVLNEILDAPFDRLHPTKCHRPAASGEILLVAAWAQWIVLMILGIALALVISTKFAIPAAILWIMGCIYNVPPSRTKDVPYLDVATEAVNNPLRMLMGWYMVTSTLVPPLSLVAAYWMLGCYFMALKRFSEYREIGSLGIAGAYRKSFYVYTERTLLKSVVFYAASAMLMLGFFIARYRLELILSIPLAALLMATYFDLSFEQHSAVQNPEKLYREPRLMLELAAMCIVAVVLLKIDLPWIHRLFASTSLIGNL